MTQVLWLTQNHPPRPGGMATSSDRITAGLRARGVRVDVVHLASGPGRRTSRTTPGGTDLYLPVGEDPEHALRLAWLEVSAWSTPTAVCAFGGILPLVAGPTFAPWLGAALVVLLRGNDFDTGIVSARRRPLLLDALRHAAAITTVATTTARQVAALVPETSVHAIPNGIDLRDWDVLPSDRDAAARWRGDVVARDATVLAVVGQLKRKKGLAVLLDAVRRMPGRRVHLLLIGDIAPEVASWLARPHAPPHTHLPFQERFALPCWYAAADWLVVPSLYDGMPNVALEAAALGVPLIASDVGGLHDLLAGSEAGLLVPPGEAAALADTLHRALGADADERRRRGEAAAALVRECYTADLESDRYASLLSSLPDART